MDRYWLLTWTTYGTWVPGDHRGSTSPVIDSLGRRMRHNIPGEPPAPPLPALAAFARTTMRAPPVRLTKRLASVLERDFRRTAGVHGWELWAGAVMSNHVHLVVAVPGDPAPWQILRALKSHSSRVLSEASGVHRPGTWWTKSGSYRRLRTEPEVVTAIEYVRRQALPLVVWARQIVE